MWKLLFLNFTKCCIVQQLPAPGYIYALCILDMLSLLTIKLALTISFLPFRCCSFHAYITWAAYKYEILVHSPSLPVWSQGMTGVHTPHWLGLLLSKCGIWTNWQMFPTESLQQERHWGPSVAVRGSSPSALLILHQKRLCHTPLLHLRSASPPFTHNSTPTPFSHYGTLSQINAEGLTWKSVLAHAGAKQTRQRPILPMFGTDRLFNFIF